MTRLTLTALPNRCGSPTHTVSAAIALGVVLSAAPHAAVADAQVRGSREAVTVEAKNTSVEDVLKALSAFDVHYHSSVNLQTRLTGNYEGSLQRVMKRVLDGYSYFVRIGDGRIDLTVLDAPRNDPSIGASDLVRVVAPPAGGAAAQPSPAIATAEPSVMAVPAAPSTAAPSSFGGVGPRPSSPPQTEEGRVGAAAPPSPAIAGVDPPAQPAPSSRRRDLAVAGGKESRPLPPRRIKIASGSGHWRKGRHHARRTRLAKSNMLCRRPVSWFGLPLMIPVSSYYWFHSEPLDVRPVPTCWLRQDGRLK
jgi:hypothetical protein